MIEQAKDLLGLGFSVIPVKLDKKPLIDWSQYQNEPMLPHEWDFPKAEAIAVVCGAVSGNMEVIDIDNPDVIEDVSKVIPKEIVKKLIVQKTQSGGYHLIYRCPEIGQNQKLAIEYKEVPTSDWASFPWRKDKSYKPKAIGDKKYISTASIETRAEGGYILVDPSPGYKIISERKFDNIATITPEERAIIIEACKSMGHQVPKVEIKPDLRKKNPDNRKEKPFDDFNHRISAAQLCDLLNRHGWEVEYEKHGNIYMRRPGKAKGVSATIGGGAEFPLLYVFTSATEFAPARAYMPYQVYGILRHNGDFVRCAQELYGLGYGKKMETIEKKIEFRSMPSIMKDSYKEIQWAVPDIIPEGLTIIAGRPKFGKSFLMLGLCHAIATGTKAWGYKNVKKGNAYYLALEDSYRRIKTRFEMMQFNEICPENLKVAVIAPTLNNGFIEAISNIVENDPNCGVIVIDTLQKIKPVSGPNQKSQNMYQVEYEDYGRLQMLAMAYGICIIAVHHTRKPPTNGRKIENPWDEMSGSTGIQGVADTLIVCMKSDDKNGKMFVTGREVVEQTYSMFFDTYAMTWSVTDSNVNIDFSAEEVANWFEEHEIMTIKQASKIFGNKSKKETLEKLQDLIAQNVIVAGIDDDGKTIFRSPEN